MRASKWVPQRGSSGPVSRFVIGLERGDDPWREIPLRLREAHLVAVAQACGIKDPTIEKRTMAEIRAALLSDPKLAALSPLSFASPRRPALRTRYPAVLFGREELDEDGDGGGRAALPHPVLPRAGAG